MALLELKSNLKTLKYQGREKPLITKDINNPPKTGGVSMQINHRIDDVARLGKLIIKKPGIKFLGNQALLAQTNIKQDIAAQKGKSAKQIAKAVLNRLKRTAIDTVLATASIIAQAPLNGTGGHIPRGIKPITYLKSGNQGGIATLAAPDGTIIPNIGPNDPANGGSFQVDDNYQITSLGDKTQNKYNNGQKWILQFGSFQQTQANDYVNIQGNPSNIVKDGGTVGGDMTGGTTYSPLADSELVEKETKTEVKAIFSGAERTYKQKPDEVKEEETYLKQIEDSRTKREEDLAHTADPIQSLEVKTASILGTSEADIIPFEFNTFYPGNTTGQFIYFRAFLDNLSDTFNGAWNPIKYVGRADNMYTYDSFSRDITFSFKIAAFSKLDLIPLYDKINALAGSTAPTYSSNGEFMKGTLTNITIGDYIIGLTGFISSFSLNWDVGSPWEIDVEEEGTLKVPHILDAQIAFTPIHDFAPTANSRFIANV